MNNVEQEVLLNGGGLIIKSVCIDTIWSRGARDHSSQFAINRTPNPLAPYRVSVCSVHPSQIPCRNEEEISF